MCIRDRSVLNGLEKRGDKKKAEKLSKQIAKMEKRMKPLFDLQRQEDIKNPPEQDQRKLVVDTYLRTLSRIPTEDEVERCMTYINESSDEARGVKDLLWALINTKEFIVNH